MIFLTLLPQDKVHIPPPGSPRPPPSLFFLPSLCASNTELLGVPRESFSCLPQELGFSLQAWAQTLPSSRKSSLCLSRAAPPPSTAQLPWLPRQVDHSVITLDCGLLKGRDHAFLISVLLAADAGLLGTVSI